MFGVFTQKLWQILKALLPAGSTLLFILISAMVWPLPYAGTVAPSLGLVAVYYWSIYRPDLFRPSVVFLLGLLNDLIHGLPTGLSAFVFVGAYQLAFSQRRFFFGQIFYMLWAGFGLVVFLATLVNWSVLSLFEGRTVAMLPVALQALITLVVFPLPAWVLIRLQRVFLSQV